MYLFIVLKIKYNEHGVNLHMEQIKVHLMLYELNNLSLSSNIKKRCLTNTCQNEW
jgi:hypothetical protein